MAARRLNPYRQGRLDGLCGVYALINALRLLCPRLDEDACERAFCALIRARARQTSSPLAVISGGLSRRELLKLIGPWQRFAARGVWGDPDGQSAQGVRSELARHLAGLVSGA